MRVFRSLEEASGQFGPCALTIGNFDGVHLGHQRIFRRVVETAVRRSWRAAALTFEPHPTRVVAPSRAPRLLSTHEERCRWMAAAGLGEVLILPFQAAFSRLSPQRFFEDVLVRRLDARAVLVGGNFRFGHRHAGDTALLAELGRRWNVEVEVVPAVVMRGHMVSSSAVRHAIAHGRVATAARMLGRPYGLSGEVVRGRGVGAAQTAPTLNLETAAELLPLHGVYVTETADLERGGCYPSVTNVGVRPTFDGQTVTVETFLLGLFPELGPRRIRVDFWLRLRPERKFPSPQALRAQILRDIARAEAYFRRRARWVTLTTTV